MGMLIINQDLSITNDNDSVFETIESFKNKEVQENLKRLKQSINDLKENGVEIGICLKFDASKF